MKIFKNVEGAVFPVMYLSLDTWNLTDIDISPAEWSRRLSQDVGLARIGCGICTTTFRHGSYFFRGPDIIVEYHTTQSCTIQAAADVLNKFQHKVFTTVFADDDTLDGSFDIVVIYPFEALQTVSIVDNSGFGVVLKYIIEVDPFEVLQNFSNFNNSEVKAVLKSCHFSKHKIYGLSCPKIHLSTADYERYPVDRFSRLLVLPYVAEQLYGNDTLYNITVDDGKVDICLTDFLTLETEMSASVLSNKAPTFELQFTSAILLVPLMFIELVRIRKFL